MAMDTDIPVQKAALYYPPLEEVAGGELHIHKPDVSIGSRTTACTIVDHM